jgi:energy-converting hydrogenase Eha subunit A
MRAAVILAGVVLGLGGFLAAIIYSIVIAWGCNGTDAGEPPSPHSLGATLCDSPAFPWAVLALGLAALIAPLWGCVVAVRRRRWAPLLGSAAAAAATVSALGLMLHAVEEGTENAALFVGLPVLACVGLTAVAIRQSRTERGQ